MIMYTRAVYYLLFMCNNWGHTIYVYVQTNNITGFIVLNYDNTITDCKASEAMISNPRDD